MKYSQFSVSGSDNVELSQYFGMFKLVAESDIVEGGGVVPAFLAKLWRLVDDEDTDELICWSEVSLSCQTCFAISMYIIWN